MVKMLADFVVTLNRPATMTETFIVVSIGLLFIPISLFVY